MSTRTRRLLVVLAATVAPLLLWAAAVPLAGADLTVDQGGTLQTVGPVMVAFAALAVALAAWGLLALLERFTHGTRTWTIIACAVLAVSLLGPLAAANTAALLVLLGMHLLVGGAVITGLAPR